MTAEEYASLKIGDRVASGHCDYNHETKKCDGPLVISTVIGFWIKPIATQPSIGAFPQEVQEDWQLIAKAKYDNERASTAKTLADL